MRNKERITPTCDTLAAVWKVVPDWRLMQFLCNFQKWARSDCFYMEDDELQQKLAEYAEYLANGGRYM